MPGGRKPEGGKPARQQESAEEPKRGARDPAGRLKPNGAACTILQTGKLILKTGYVKTI